MTNETLERARIMSNSMAVWYLAKMHTEPEHPLYASWLIEYMKHQRRYLKLCNRLGKPVPAPQDPQP